MLGPRLEGNGWGSPGWVEMFQFDAEGGPVAVPWIGRDTPQDAEVPLRGSGMECPKDSGQSDGNPVVALSGERPHPKEWLAACNRSYD